MTDASQEGTLAQHIAHEGHLIPPIWMEENKEAFDAMKAQVEREEARRSDMGVDVASLRSEALDRDKGRTHYEGMWCQYCVTVQLCDLLDAKERELDATKEALQHIANAPTPYNTAIPLAFTHCIALARTTLQALDGSDES